MRKIKARQIPSSLGRIGTQRTLGTRSRRPSPNLQKCYPVPCGVTKATYTATNAIEELGFMFRTATWNYDRAQHEMNNLIVLHLLSSLATISL